ncbi:MAG: DUF3106 domain-containing protein [Planctomycetes bacterium]|nr:DUF3106 domain-containing protein [Planctomycetota bacterium]
MSTQRALTILAATAALLATAPAKAQSEEFEKNLERWQKMSPDQREKVRRRYEVWKKLPAEEKKAIRKRLARLREMSADDREEVLARMKIWRELPAEKRKQILARWDRWANLGDDKRREVQVVAGVMEILPPQTRKALRDLPLEEKKRIFKGIKTVFMEVPPQARQRFLELPPDQRRKEFRRFLQAKRERLEEVIGPLGPLTGPLDDDARGRTPFPPELQRFWHSLSLEEQAELHEKARLAPPDRQREEFLRLLQERYRRSAGPR